MRLVAFSGAETATFEFSVDLAGACYAVLAAFQHERVEADFDGGELFHGGDRALVFNSTEGDDLRRDRISSRMNEEVLVANETVESFLL